jgi:bis(5'-nucleosidyl)-tetraphosphatase
MPRSPYNRGTKVGRYYLAQTPEDQVVFAVNPKIGGPEHHAYRWLSYPELEKRSPPRLLPVISRARNGVEG